MTVSSYHLPASVPEALDLMDTYGSELLVKAGGTVVMPLINEGISLPRHVMGLARLGLDEMEMVDGSLRIGAATTLTRLRETSPVPLLREAAGRTASWSIRNLGTVGGNLFTPPPGGDVAVALLALDARVVLTSRAGDREVPLTAFYHGFMATDLRFDELLTAVVVPPVTGETAYLKLGRKRDNTPAVVTVAARVVRERGVVTEARVALGAAGPHPMRIASAESALLGSELGDPAILAAADAASKDAEPFTDGVASDWYRRRMVGVYVARALEEISATTAEGVAR